MELNWLILLHSVYYRAFGYPSKDEQSKGNVDHHETAEMFIKCHNKDDQMMFKKCGRGGGGCSSTCCFQMPLHYPRYKKSDYEKMEAEWKVDMLLNEYGLCYNGTLEEKRKCLVRVRL